MPLSSAKNVSDVGHYKRPKIHIPDSALTVKANFWSEPSREKQMEIKRFIIEKGKPFLHPDVTHSRPPPNAKARYLEEFDLPPKFSKNPDLWCPCPICTPDRPQFKERGIITWWPEEGVIRVIGGDCFKTLNPEGHEEAARLYAKEVKRRKNERYLLSKLWTVPLLRHDLLGWRTVAATVDETRAKILEALSTYNIALWSNVRNGQLYTEKRIRVFTHGKGNHTHLVQRELYASLRGFGLLDPRLSDFARKLFAIDLALSQIDFGTRPDDAILALSEPEKGQTATLLKSSIKEIKTTQARLQDVRRFLSPESVATLRTWSSLPDTVCPFYFAYYRNELRIGASPSQSMAIQVPSEFFESLPEITTAASSDND